MSLPLPLKLDDQLNFFSDFLIHALIAVLSLFVVFTVTGTPVPLLRSAWRQLQVLTQPLRTTIIDQQMHGGSLVAQVLKSHGVQTMFTLSGGHIAPILVGAEKAGIRVIDTRHEVNAVFAADAVARVTGVPGVAVVTAGPGLTNTVTAVKNAQMAESPVVLMGGCAATLAKGRGALQDIDHLSVFKSITKWQTTVTRVRDIVPAVRQAFCQAQSGTPGPVFVEFPLDVLYQFSVVQREFMGKTSGSGILAKLVSWYLNNYADHLFAGNGQEQDTSPLPFTVPQASESDVGKAADLLMTAKSPLILLQSQAVLAPVGGDGLRQVIEDLGIPVYLGGMARGLLGAQSPLLMRQNRKEALKEADVVLLGGVVADFRLGYGTSLSRRSQIIAVNRDKGQLYKNARLYWNPAVAVQSDVGTFLKRLRDELRKRSFRCPAEWTQRLRQRDEQTEARNAGKADQPVDKYLNPIKVLSELDGVLPDNTYLVADGGDFVATASYIVRPRGPLRWLDPGAFGTLGCGGGFALGIKASIPHANVVIIYGDGSVGFTIMELDTMTRHKLPCTAVVGNDACWTQIAREQVPMLGSPVACPLAYTDYHKVAQGLGGLGVKLDDSDAGRLSAAFLDAMQSSKDSMKPILVNVLIGKTDFREGSVSV